LAKRPAGALFRRALDHFQRRELGPAETICNEILAAHPEDGDALGLAGTIALMAGRPADAALRLGRAAKLNPSSYTVLSNLGSAYVELHRFAEAAEIFARALALRPDYRPAYFNLAGAYKGMGAFDEAIARLSPLAAGNGKDDTVLVELAGLHVLAGRAEAGIALYGDAIAAAPSSLAARQGLAYLLKQRGRAAEAVEHYRWIAERKPTDNAAQIDLGFALIAAGAATDAIATLRRALVKDPTNVAARAALGELFRDRVPAWHVSMLNHDARNDAYDAAIRHAVKTDSTVLDIGTGSGLLAMMAARAGALHVYACEAQPLLAEKAREIVRANGFADRITIIAKTSQQLRVGEDLPRRADVLVSEIVDTELIGEGICATLNHALRELVDPGAAIIPRAGSIRAMLVESAALHRQDRVARAAGFDLGAFNEFARYNFAALDLRHFAHRAISGAIEIFRFDFTRPNFRHEAKSVAIPVATRGTCHALLTWFELELDEERRLSSGPDSGGESWHWQQAVYLFDAPRLVEPGDAIRVAASHDTQHVRFLLEGGAA
jgi:type II protein arginine methyltransferase